MRPPVKLASPCCSLRAGQRLQLRSPALDRGAWIRVAADDADAPAGEAGFSLLQPQSGEAAAVGFDREEKGGIGDRGEAGLDTPDAQALWLTRAQWTQAGQVEVEDNAFEPGTCVGKAQILSLQAQGAVESAGRPGQLAARSQLTDGVIDIR